MGHCLAKQCVVFGLKKRGSFTTVKHNNVSLYQSSSSNSTILRQNNIKICFVNARSLRNKFTDLETLALTENYDIIGITETWINTEVRDYLAEFALPGYSIFNAERKDKVGGGAILYVKPYLSPILITKPNINNIDSVYIQIKNNSHDKLTLGITYRPPAQSSEIDAILYDQLADTFCQGDTIIFGDFYLPVTIWGSPLISHTGQGLYKICKRVHGPN